MEIDVLIPILYIGLLYLMERKGGHIQIEDLYKDTQVF
uniref:Uncharacterized protein n=1 Tax=viral metagenome TaxID=1070528 RepID=A0A6C0K150_9ZZZZ